MTSSLIHDQNEFLEYIFDGSEDLKKYNHGRFFDIVQPLSDLGYLQILGNERLVHYPEFRKAVTAFRKEILKTYFLKRSQLGPDLPHEDSIEHMDNNTQLLQSVDYISTEELLKLHQFVQLEGINSIKLNDQKDYTVLELRILRYRAYVYGLYEINGPLDYRSIRKAFTDFKIIHGFDQIEKAIEICDDPNVLINHLLLNNDLPEKIYIRIELNSSEIRKQIGKLTAHQKDGRPAFITKKEGEVAKKNFKDKTAKSLQKIFQIRLWQYGFYTGALDGLYGPMTLRAIEELCNFEELLNHDRIQGETISNVIEYRGSQWWAINTLELLKLIYEKEDNYDFSIVNEYKNLKDKIQSDDRDKPLESFHTELNTQWRKGNKEISNNLKSNNHFIRRVYFGVKSILKKIWNGLKWVFNKIEYLVKEFLSAIRSFAGIMFREIREGIKLFGLGLEFLFGKRVITTTRQSEYIISKFDFDCDSFNYINTDSQFQINEHIMLLDNYMRGLSIALELTAISLKTIFSINQPILLSAVIGDSLRKIIFKLNMRSSEEGLTS